MPAIKDHPIIVVSGLIISAFVAGISAFIWFDGEIDKRIKIRLEAPIEQSVPIGTIVAFYSKNGEIPEGWAICNGDNGTPDLRNRFLKGAGTLSENGRKGGKNIVEGTIKIGKLKLVTGANDELALHTRDKSIGIAAFRTTCSDCVTLRIERIEGESETFKTYYEPPYTNLVYIMKI